MSVINCFSTSLLKVIIFFVSYHCGLKLACLYYVLFALSLFFLVKQFKNVINDIFTQLLCVFVMIGDISLF